MTESDYQSPLIELLYFLCFNYSEKMFDELAKLQENIQHLNHILDDCDDSLKLNSFYDKFRQYSERFESKRLDLLQFISHFDENVLQVVAILEAPLEPYQKTP